MRNYVTFYNMKTQLFTLVLIILFIQPSYAQSINIPQKIEVTEGMQQLDDVERNGFNVVLAGSEKDIIKAFEDYLEKKDKNYDVKSFFKKISAENILVPSFSDKHFNLNAEVRESGSTISLWYWVSLGENTFISSTTHPDEAAKCKALLKDFGKTYFSSFIATDVALTTEKLEESEDNLEDVIDDIADLTKDQQKEKKRQEKLEKKKQQLESKLAELQIDIKEKDAEIEKVNADIDLLSTKINAKNTSKADIERKITEQRQTLDDLNKRLSIIKTL